MTEWRPVMGAFLYAELPSKIAPVGLGGAGVPSEVAFQQGTVPGFFVRRVYDHECVSVDEPLRVVRHGVLQVLGEPLRRTCQGAIGKRELRRGDLKAQESC